MKEQKTLEELLKEEKVDPKLFFRFLMMAIKDNLPSKKDLYNTNPSVRLRTDMIGFGSIIGGIGSLFVSGVLRLLGYHEIWPFILLLGMIIGQECGFLGYLKRFGLLVEFEVILFAVMEGAFLGFVITLFISRDVFMSLGGAACGMVIMEKVRFAWWRSKLESLRLKGLL
ncbi:MAG: hypothetical protein SVO01_02630 [Thermotogota bacterium]|nr:hypothetical protein [Thermotogota bacterium]